MMKGRRWMTAVLAAAMVLGSTMPLWAEEETEEELALETEQETEEETEEEEPGEQLDAILEAGVIVIGNEGTYPPYSYHDEDGELVGFEVEIGKAIAEKLGVEAEFAEANWDALLAGLEAKRFDIVINDVSPTEERRKTYNFSDPYTVVRYALITREDNDEITSFEDLDGKKTSNTISSTHALIAEEYGAEVLAVDTFEQSIEMVLTGRADATINSELVYYDYMDRQPDAPLKVAAFTETGAVTAIPVRKGEGALLKALNKALAELSEEGVLTELSEKYFGKDITPHPEEAEPETELETEDGTEDQTEAETEEE